MAIYQVKDGQFPSNMEAVPSLSGFTAESDSAASKIVVRGLDRVSASFGHDWSEDKPGFVAYCVTLVRSNSGRYTVQVWKGYRTPTPKGLVKVWFLNGRTYWTTEESLLHYAPLQDAITGILAQECNFTCDRFLGQGPGMQDEPITGEEIGLAFGRKNLTGEASQGKWRSRGNLMKDALENGKNLDSSK
jgi:hypothetical protein